MTSRLRYLPQLDGLRALAVGAVVLHHLPTRLGEGGYIGVDVFFVLSGFLITRILREEVTQSGTVSIGDFYVRRLRRLLPALLFLATAVALYWVLVTSAPGRRATLIGVPLSVFYVGSWFKAFGLQTLGALGHTWSLSVEEHFYFAWPLVVRRLGQRRTLLLRVTSALLALSATEWYVGYALGWAHDRLVFAPDTRAKDILAGCLLALVLERSSSRKWTRVGVLAAAVIGAWAIAVPKESSLYMLGWPIVIIGASVLIASLFLAEDSALARLLSRREMVWIGQRSYGIYLWHFPLTVINSTIVTWSRGSKALVAVGTTVGSVVLAELSMRLVERRFRSSAIPKRSTSTVP